MNKVYKVVWNASLGIWVAVSEIAKGKTKKATKVQTVGIAVAIIGAVSFSPDAFAGGYSAGGGYINSGCSSSSMGASGQTGAIAIGGNSQNPCASQPYTIAIGNNAKALSQGSIAIGSGAYADSSSSADGTGAVAIGNDAVALGKNSFALGAEASVTTDNTVSFGHATGDDKYNNGSKVGTWTTDRFMRLANVANGYKNNDAVNVSQITPLATALGTTVNTTTGVVAPPSYTINKTDGTSYSSVATVPQALANLNTEVVKAITFSGNTGSSANKLGSTLNITGAGSTVGTYSGNNLKTAVSGNTVSIQMADAPTFTGTVTAGNLATGGTLSVTGVSNLNGGANLNNQKITNVASGTASGDAVNFGQLTTTNNNVTTAQNAANAAQTSANAAQTTANSALTEAQKGLNFRANAGATDKVSLGETVTLADGTNTTVTYDAATNTYKYSVVNAPTFTGTVTAGNLATSGTLSVTGVSNLNGGANLNNQKITNVADGSIAAGSKDAVNGGQLFTTNQNVSTNATNIATNTSNIATNTTDISNLQGQTFKLQANGDTASAVASSDTVQFIDGDNIDITRSGNDITIATSKDLTVDSVTAGNSKLDNNGLVITGGPSITTTGIDAGSKVISNVADGSVAAGSKDAVNGGQLFTTNQNVSTNATNIATNTSNIATNTSNIATNTSNIATNTTDISNLQGQTFKLQANGDTASAVASSDTVQFIDGDNIDITRSGNDITIATSKDLTVDSVTAGNSKLDNNGLVITGGPSITTTGIDAGSKVISNVADGSVAAGSKDAVNGGQLFTTNQNVSTNATNIATNTSNIATNTSNIATNTSNIATNTTDISNLQGQTFKLQANGDTASAVASSDTVQFIDGDNIDITRSGNDITIATSKDLTVDSVTAGNSKLDNSGLVITGGPSITTTGIDAGSKVISNVADGSVAAGSKDAVNGGQLFTTNQNVSTNATNIATNTSNIATNTSNIATNTSNIATNTTDISNLQGQTFKLQANGDTASAVASSDTVQFIDGDNIDITRSGNDITIATSKDLTVDSVTAGNSKLDNNGLVITGGPSITTTGIDAGSKVISNVADGSVAAGSKDAVNGGQLFTTNQNVSTNATNIATNTSNIATNTSNIATNTSNIATNTTDISNLQGQTFKLQANGDTASAVASSDTVQFIDGDNIDITRSGNDITIATSKT